MKVPFRDSVPGSGFGMWRHAYLTGSVDRPSVREAPGRRLPTLVDAFKASWSDRIVSCAPVAVACPKFSGLGFYHQHVYS